MKINPTHKGKRGEVEFCKWLSKNFNIDVEREYNQSQGGADIIINDFIFEIKRREVLDLKTWWQQVCIAKKKHPDKELIQIVAYRQNRKPWNFLIPANLVNGIERGFLICEEKIFIEFMNYVVEKNNDR